MLAYPFEEKRLTKWSPPYIVQPKLDGERCRCVFDEDLGWQLISSQLETFNSVPHIIQAIINSKIPLNVELDGELYIHGVPFEEIHSRVSRTVNPHWDYQSITYHVFDLVNQNLPQWERLRLLRRLEESFRPGLRIVEMRLAEDLEGVTRAYDEFVRLGYEGIIIRHVDAAYIRSRSIFVMKFKPKKEDTYKIVGFKQMIDKEGRPKSMLGSLICSGDDGTEFSVGSGLTDELRLKWWPEENAQTLVGKSIKVKYQHLTPGRGAPRFPVFIEVVESEKFVNPLL
jgi:DNA ligase-1